MTHPGFLLVGGRWVTLGEVERPGHRRRDSSPPNRWKQGAAADRRSGDPRQRHSTSPNVPILG
jgi:hypothetical protein